MGMLRTVFVFLLFTAFFPAGRASALPHISDFPLGISRQEALLRSVSPCGDNLCGKANFGGKSWDIALAFRHGGLFALSLSGPPETDYMDAAFRGLTESPYVLYGVIAENMCFDFVFRSREGAGPEQLDEEFAEFLLAMRSSGSGFAAYLYTEPALYEAARRGPDNPSQPCGPQNTRDMPGGVVCCLLVTGGRISVAVMTWNDWQRELGAHIMYDGM